MKQIKLLGVLAIALCLGLSSCGKGGEDVSGGDVSTSEQGSEEHVHTFETEWTSNGSKHWHKATCGHNVKDGEAEHTFGEPYDVVAATCTEDGSQKRKCTVCEYVKTEKLTKLGHIDPPAEGSDAWIPGEDATCTEDGYHSYHCTRCDQDVRVTLPKLGHQYEQVDGEDKVTWSQEVDCLNPGIGTKTCLRCGASENVRVEALGHNWGEWEVTLEATCTAAGSRKHKCARCNFEEAEAIAALGHDIHLVDDQGEPEAGKAKVRLYDCSRCDVTYLGFKATEVTAASHDRLVFEEYTSTDADGNEVKEQGARFFGHPIGNDVELDPTTGDPTEGNPAIYSKTQTGDFFEYVFDLTDEQVAALSGDEGACLCYVDALPANWMQQNNMDFFAKGTETDWTKAYYIDEDPAHYQQATDDNGTPDDTSDDFPKVDEQGNPVMEAKEIAGWRYVLYVDGHYQDFDADVATNKMADNNRKEFVIPYLFKLHKGENRISLRMAAGYRCTFFNFTFRPYVKPTQITVNETSISVAEYGLASITSSMTGLKYESSSSSVCSVDANGVVTGLKAGTATITVSKEGNFKPARVPVTVTEALPGKFQIAANKGTIAPEGSIEVYSSSYGGGTRLRNFQFNSTLTFTFDSNVIGPVTLVFNARGSNVNFADHISVKVNGADVAVRGSFNSANSGVDTVVGQATLKAEGNTLVITTISTNSPINLHYVMFVPAEGSEIVQPEGHTHEYTVKSESIEEEGCTKVDVYNCKDLDASALRWEAKNYDSTLSNEIEAAASDGSIRFNRAQGKNGEDDKGGHLVYKINSPVAAEGVELQFYIQAHSQNVAIFDVVSGDSGAGKDVDPATGKYTVTPEKRYALYVNDQKIALGEDPGASSAKDWFTFPAKFNLNKGVNTIEIVSLGGYRAKMYNFQLSGLPKINYEVKTWSSEDIKNGLTEGKTLTEKDFNTSLEGVKGYKFNKADTTCTLNVNVAEGGTYVLELLLGVKGGNQAKTGFWYQVDSTQDPLPAKDKITVNGKDVVPPANDVDFSDCTTASDQTDSGTLMVPQWKTVCAVTLEAGDNTIVISYLAGGYSLYLCGARLSK